MATPSDVLVFKSTHASNVHGRSSLENTTNLRLLNPIAINSFINKKTELSRSTNDQVMRSMHSDSFQNVLGIDGYLRRHGELENKSVDNIYNNLLKTEANNGNIPTELCYNNCICLPCEEENTMNNNRKISFQNIGNRLKEGYEICEETNYVQENQLHHKHQLSLESNGRSNPDIDTQPRKQVNPENYRELLHVECPKSGIHTYELAESRQQKKCHENVNPFSLKGEDQMNKKTAFDVNNIPLLGLSAGAKRDSNIFAECSSVKFPEYSHGDSTHNIFVDCTSKKLPEYIHDDSRDLEYNEHCISTNELSSKYSSNKSAALLEEYASGYQVSKSQPRDAYFIKSDNIEVKENCFHPVETGIEKMTLHNTQKITSFDSCTCINPGSCHACASRAPAYGILNPLFDDTLRINFLGRNLPLSKTKSQRTQGQPPSSSFEPMNLCLPPLANAPNTQGIYYYLPYSLPCLSNVPINTKKTSTDSIIPIPSDKWEPSKIMSTPKSVIKKNDASLTEIGRKFEMCTDAKQIHSVDAKQECSSKSISHNREGSGFAKERSNFLSPASGEITLPYSPPDMQEELLFPNSSYSKDTEIIQNLNAQEKDFILGRPNRKPREIDHVELVKEAEKSFSKVHHSRRKSSVGVINRTSVEKCTNNSHVSGNETRITPNVSTAADRNGEKYTGDIVDGTCAGHGNQNRLIAKRLSLPVNIPIKLDEFDRPDHVSNKSNRKNDEVDIPHCLRLNCMDPCTQGSCLNSSGNSIGKSLSLTNFSGLSNYPVQNKSKPVDKAVSQRRSSDTSLNNCFNAKKGNTNPLDTRTGKQDMFGYQVTGKRRRLLKQQRSTLHEDVELEAERKSHHQPLIPQDKLLASQKNKYKYSESKVSEPGAPFEDMKSAASHLECYELSDNYLLSKKEHGNYVYHRDSGLATERISRSKQDLKVNDCPQSSFSSDDGLAHSTRSVSQDSSDNSNDSKKSLSLLDRRRNAAKRKDKLKLKILDHSSSEEIFEEYDYGTQCLRNDGSNVPSESIENSTAVADSQISQTENPSAGSLIDDLTNYWLESPSPNSLTPYPFYETCCDLPSGTNTHSLPQHPEASGFSKQSDLTSSNKFSTNYESKHKKRSRAVPTNSALTVFENPVSMANCSPEADKTLTREIVKNIIEERKYRSKSNSTSSPTDLQIDSIHPSRLSQRPCKQIPEISPEVRTSVPYQPLVTPSPVSPCGGIVGGSTPLLLEGCNKTFLTPVHPTGNDVEEDASMLYTADVDENKDDRRTLQKTVCLESSGAIRKRSFVSPPSERPKRHHSRRRDTHRQHHHHSRNHKRTPSSSSSSEDSSSSDSSSSSSSSDSSSSSSDSSSDLEDIVHLRP